MFNKSSVSLIPSWDSESFKFDFSSFKSFIFKKLIISDVCVSLNFAPDVSAPLSSILFSLNKSVTPEIPKFFLSILSTLVFSYIFNFLDKAYLAIPLTNLRGFIAKPGL